MFIHIYFQKCKEYYDPITLTNTEYVISMIRICLKDLFNVAKAKKERKKFKFSIELDQLNIPVVLSKVLPSFYHLQHHTFPFA